MNRSTFQSVLTNKMGIYFGEGLFAKNAIKKPLDRNNPRASIGFLSLVYRDFGPLDHGNVFYVLIGSIQHLVISVQSFIIVAGGISALISR